jgi:DNA primase
MILAPDGDAPGLSAADTLATRAHALGWKVSMMQAPPGRDRNDIAMEGAA